MALEQITFNLGALDDAANSGKNYVSGQVFEVFNIDDTYADIFADSAGTIHIDQSGIQNISNSDGECKFFIDKGFYNIKSGGKTRQLNANFNFEFETVSDAVNARFISLFEGRRVFIVERGAYFNVVLTSSVTINGLTNIQSAANPLYSFKLLDKFNVKLERAGAVYDDESAAVINSQVLSLAESTFGNVYLHNGKRLYLSSTFTIENNKSFSIHSPGLGVSSLVFINENDGIVFSDPDAFEGTLTISGVEILTKVASTATSAVKSTHTSRQPSLITKDVSIRGIEGGEWKYGIDTFNAAESSFDNTILRGANEDNFVGLRLQSDKDAVSVTISGVSVYSANIGITVINTTQTGIEGIKLADVDLVGVSRGFNYVNTSGYSPPQINFVNTHINASEINVYIDTASQVNIGSGCLFYNRGTTGNSVKLIDVDDLIISDCVMASISGGDVIHVDISGDCNAGIISDVIFKMAAGSVKQCIKLDSAVTGVIIDDVIRKGGGQVLLDENGTNILLNHFPRDNQAVESTASISSGVVDISTVKSNDYIRVTDSTGTVTSFTHKFAGQVFTVKNNGSITLQHNANLILRNNTDYTYTAGAVVTFKAESGGVSREISRSE